MPTTNQNPEERKDRAKQNHTSSFMAQAARALQNILEGANEPRNRDDEVFVLKVKTEYKCRSRN